MSFEPLQTDEKLETPVEQERDTDTVMLFGCGSFVASSLITYMLTIWPFFVFREIHLFGELIKCALAGLLPALVFGAYVTRAHGLAPAAGFVGGGMAAAIFLYLRLVEVNLRRVQRELAQPDYPDIWVWIVPMAWVVALVLVAMVMIRPSEIDISGRKTD